MSAAWLALRRSFISALDVDGSEDNKRMREWFNQLISRIPPLKGGEEKGKEAEDLGDGGQTSQWKVRTLRGESFFSRRASVYWYNPSSI